MKIEILDEAEQDLVEGSDFYERQCPGLGDYFLDSLYAEIDSLSLYAGIHHKVYGACRLLARRFPYAVYYSVDKDVIHVKAILDCRRDPQYYSLRLNPEG